MDEERWYTVADIVEKLRVHEQTVRRWLRDGDLKGYNFGGKSGYRIRASDLDVFVESYATRPEMGKVAA